MVMNDTVGSIGGASSRSLSGIGRLKAAAVAHRVAFMTAGVAVVGTASVVAGSMSTFTSTETKTQAVGTGTFIFDLANGAVPFSTAISSMGPADVADRLVTLTNTGSIDFASIDLGVTATSSSSLDTDATNGLFLTIDKCSQAWTQANNSAAATCGGSTTAVTTVSAISDLKTTGPSYTSVLGSLTHGGTDYLRFHYLLPSTYAGAGAGVDTTSTISSTLSYLFTATQVAGGTQR